MNKDAFEDVEESPVSRDFCEKELDNFCLAVEATSCYIVVKDKVLVVRIAKDSPEKGFWGVPAGKVEEGESLDDALIREMKEELGIELEKEKLNYVGKLFGRSHIDYHYHVYGYFLDEFPEITLNEENDQYKWVTREELLKMPYMKSAVFALDFFYKNVNAKR